LDPQTGKLLAEFRHVAINTFGGKPAILLWKAMDRRNKRKLTFQQFHHEIQQMGFTGKVKTLAKWLDWEGRGYIIEEDMQILDTWRPPPWLVAKPNNEAAEELKRAMKQKYGHFLKAWRQVMDKDNSNSCNWHEFVHAAKLLKFHGDVVGAWLVFDRDCSGAISLAEIDPDANAILCQFKQWAIEEFGGVRSAFRVMDADSSNELTYKEFRLAMREYGFSGDAALLFESLDASGERRLQHKDVTFLDSWDLGGKDGSFSDHDGYDAEASMDLLQEHTSTLLDYMTDNPGPGAYNVVSGFGAMPMMPTAKHGGSFSFTGRDKRQGWLRNAKTVGPAHYETLSARGGQQRKKPAWTFGSGRSSSAVRPPPTASPGPGAYDTKASTHGPQFSMGQRWGVTLHPSQRPIIAGSRTPRSYHC